MDTALPVLYLSRMVLGARVRPDLGVDRDTGRLHYLESFSHLVLGASRDASTVSMVHVSCQFMLCQRYNCGFDRVGGGMPPAALAAHCAFQARQVVRKVAMSCNGVPIMACPSDIEITSCTAILLLIQTCSNIQQCVAL